MKVSRFGGLPRLAVVAAFVGLCLLGLYACVHALGVLTGHFPVGVLPLYPAWTASHFLSAIAFMLLLPLQLWPGLRTRRPGLHRPVGRALVGIGSVMAVSGLAMAYLSPDRPIAERVFMTTFFAIYGFVLIRGYLAARVRDVAGHRAWMIRMMAVAITPLTQRAVFGLLAGAIGIDGLARFWELFVSAAWLGLAIDLIVAEWWLRSGARRTFAASPAAATEGS